MSPDRYVQVAVPVPVDGPFTYRVPPGMELRIGHAVQVGFGRRRLTGYVVGESEQPPKGVRSIKPVERLLDPEPALNEEQLRFCRWAAGYYLTGLGEVIATALPSPYRGRSRRVHIATDAGIAALALAEDDTTLATTVLRDVVARPGRTRSAITRSLQGEAEADAAGRALDSLVRRGLVEVEERVARAPGARVRTVSLLGDPHEHLDSGGARMRSVLARLIDAGGTIDLPLLVRLEGPGARDAVKRLEARGLVECGDREDRTAADPASASGQAGPAPVLNEDQQAALEAITGDEVRTWLLLGVTGSGKTEVYLRAAARVLEAGRQVVVLVPEIALTPQLTGRFRARFGNRVAVLHSGLTSAARLREWRRIRAGEADVAVGARSALFAPFRDLGLIIVDEEHDDSYKQDDGVRYHARDLAVVRGAQIGCPVVLGSATPALETWQNARDGRYGLLRMPRRATPRPVPSLEIIDMRGRPVREPLAEETLEALRGALGAGGKAIVLYNRRGYAPVVECGDCGANYRCPSCGVGMVYHQRRQTVTCHYCGYRVRFQRECGSCGGELEVLGHGTERIEEALQSAFPGVGIARMDADTTKARGAHAEILERFRTGEARLLVGTQVVAKGHDFPGVHVAAVVGVDHILAMPDFRSAERTFALVTQMGGRAGRGDAPGRVVVQTRHADHFVFRYLAAQDVPPSDGDLPINVAAAEAFYAEEARQRGILGYPPFARIVMLRVEGVDEAATRSRARELAQRLRITAPRGDGPRPAVEVLGPTAAPLSRLVGRWRFQVVLRGRDLPRFRRWLQQIRPDLRGRARKGVRVTVDVDPRNLL